MRRYFVGFRVKYTVNESYRGTAEAAAAAVVVAIAGIVDIAVGTIYTRVCIDAIVAIVVEAVIEVVIKATVGATIRQG
jgi:hypothetical protein